MAGVHHQKLKALSKSCVMLIVIAGEERFAFKGVAANLVTYLTDVVKMSNSAAAKTVNSWCGLTSIMPLMVAPLADSYWSRYSTILSFSFIYLVGLAALTSTAYTWTASTAEKPSASFSFLFFSLCLTSLGQGGFNPSLQAFGADQLDNDDETIPSSTKDSSNNKSNKKSSFFKWWYFGVCTGSLLGVTVMSYIQDTFGWVLGFAIPMMAMLTAMIFFVCGSRVYMYKSDDGKEAIQRKPFINIVRSVKAAASKFRNSSKTSLPNEKSEEMELELQERPLCPNKEAAKELDENIQNGSYLVQNAKIVLRLIPMWTMLLMFAVIFQQPATFFTKQGMTMKRNIGSHFKIPPATLQSAITVSIILLMPLYDTLFIPVVQKITRNEKGISVLQRMGIGMFLSVIAMIIAAVVETKRIELSIETNTIERSKGGNLQTVPLSIFWLLPQYVLLGISDIFTVVGMQEFFYNEVPMRMRTMAFALYTSVFGVGSFLSALMITCIEVVTTSGGGYSWFSDDMSKARLDKYYWLLALATALSLVLYIILCKFYKSRSELENGNCK